MPTGCTWFRQHDNREIEQQYFGHIQSIQDKKNDIDWCNIVLIRDEDIVCGFAINNKNRSVQNAPENFGWLNNVNKWQEKCH